MFVFHKYLNYCPIFITFTQINRKREKKWWKKFCTKWISSYKLYWASMSCSERKYFSQILHRYNTMHQAWYIDTTHTDTQCETKLIIIRIINTFRRDGLFSCLFLFEYRLSFSPNIPFLLQNVFSFFENHFCCCCLSIEYCYLIQKKKNFYFDF